MWNLTFGQGIRSVAHATLQRVPKEFLSVENRGYDPMRLSRVVLLRHVQAMFLEDALAIDGIVATRRYLEVGNRCHEKVAYSIVRVTHAHGPLGIFMACFKSGIKNLVSMAL